MSNASGKDRGSRRWLPSHRRMAVDIAIAAQSVPSFPVVRTMQLGTVDAARRDLPSRVGWTALFVHAYSQICSDTPELRELFVRWPTNYLYRHPEPVASITVHRSDDQGNERLIWGRMASPHQQSIHDIQSAIDGFAHHPIEAVFRDGLRLESRPAVVRRATWWILTQWSGRRRAKAVGTFTVSSLGQLGALNGHHPLITTTSLAIGPILPDGSCDVALICDHRAIDGALAAKVLQMLESKLQQWASRHAQTTDSSLERRAG